YICLSYVWGGMEEFQLEEGEHGIPSYYEKAGSLEGAPATIEDAMAVCRILDKKYLWVDRLCIPQDGSQKSKKDREAQIGQMGRIYNHAFVTLAAVEGADPRHGLHGVSTRLQLKPAPYKGVYLVARSKWATRAWTLQEAVLSRRLMLFTAHDVVLESE
ncbi:heterokaryon incompatibility, partial [Cryphonectria parasitica EP155]